MEGWIMVKKRLKKSKTINQPMGKQFLQSSSTLLKMNSCKNNKKGFIKKLKGIVLQMLCIEVQLRIRDRDFIKGKIKCTEKTKHLIAKEGGKIA